MTDDQFEEKVHEWWVMLNKDRAARSAIRHQSDILGIMMCEPFYRLVRMIPDMWGRLDTLACVAMAVGSVDVDSKESAATLMGRKSGLAAPVSDLRFKRLMESDAKEASRLLTRLLPIIDRKANVRNMARIIKYWDNPNQLSKKKWMVDYYLHSD